MLYEPGMIFQPLLLARQNSHFPCPNGNNTNIGDIQKFNVLCGTDIGGVEINRMPQDSLKSCVTICTTHQLPRCDGVTFTVDNICIFKSLTDGPTFSPLQGADSATGLPANPPPTSNCASLGVGSIELVHAKNFNLQCNQIFAGNDIEQQFQPSFADCLNACGNNTACGGVSFDPQQTDGFRNCYIKTSVTASGLLAKTGVDSAFIASNNGAAPANPAASAAIPTTNSLLPTTSSSPVIPGSMEIGLPLSPTSVAAVTTTTSMASPMEDATATSSLPTQTSIHGFPSQAPSSASRAWIAAPIIGGLAALTLILSIFILWGRRRSRNGRKHCTLHFGFLWKQLRGKRGGSINDDGGLPRGRSFFGGEKLADEEQDVRTESSTSARRLSTVSVSAGYSRPPPGRRGGVIGFKVLSGSGRRVGHESRTKGTGPGLDGIMVVGTRPGLRDSQNGLRLNGVSSGFTESVPGIPEGFAGPADDTVNAR